MITFPQICYMSSSRCQWRCERRIVRDGVGDAQCAIISVQIRQTWRTISRKTTSTNVTSVPSAVRSSGRATLWKSTFSDCTMTSPSVALSAPKCFLQERRWKPTWKVTLCSRRQRWRKAIQWCSKCWCPPLLLMQNKISPAFFHCSWTWSLVTWKTRIFTQMSSLAASNYKYESGIFLISESSLVFLRRRGESEYKT